MFIIKLLFVDFVFSSSINVISSFIRLFKSSKVLLNSYLIFLFGYALNFLNSISQLFSLIIKKSFNEYYLIKIFYKSLIQEKILINDKFSINLINYYTLFNII